MTDTTETTGPAGAADVPPAATPDYGPLVAGLRATYDRGRTRPLTWRRAQLEGLRRMLTEGEADLIRALREDLGRPPLEGYAADVGFAKSDVRNLLRNLDAWARPRKVSAPLPTQPAKARIVPEPLGVVLVIAPWNYPVQLLVSPLAAALAAGNCVVAKPSEVAPASAAALARLLPRYLDDDAVVVVEGGVPETTALLEERFDHIFFTGSTNVGRVVMRAAAEHLTPVTLELGGKSPVVVAADADLPVTARRLVWGKFLNAGQTCIAPDYVLAEATVRDDLVTEMATALEDFYGPDPHQSPDLGRVVSAHHLARLEDMVDTSGGTIEVGGDADRRDRYLAPTIITDPDLDSRLMQEEIFGPVLPVLAVESVDDAVAFVNARPKPLALYVFSADGETVDTVLSRTTSGGACVNHCALHVIPHDLPFGGVGPSGMGSYHGRAGFDTFSHLKSVLHKPTRPDPSIQYPPYTKLKEAIVHKAL